MFKAVKSLLSLAIFWFVVACETTSVGAVYIAGAPAKIEIRENAPDGVMVQGMDVVINGEFIGTAKRIGKVSGGLREAKIAFEPVRSKYGEVKIYQNISSSLASVNINFDVYIAGAYAGNVQMTQSI